MSIGLKKFNVTALKPGDILAGRNEEATQAGAIRLLLGSYTNHNALILKHNTRGWCVGDTFPPHSCIVSLADYEELMAKGYKVRIWRVKDASDAERERVSMYWQQNCDRLAYSEWSMGRLWIFRVVNSLPYKIHGVWCSRNTGIPWTAVVGPSRSPMRKPSGRLKKNETPRTWENRLVRGLLEDVTDEVIV